jgi:hypothetical protein
MNPYSAPPSFDNSQPSFVEVLPPGASAPETEAHAASHEGIAETMTQQFKASKHFRRHSIVGALGTLISLALWLFISFGVPHLFIFPIWVAYFFSMTLSTHYFVVSKKPRDWLNLHHAFFIFTNIAIIFTWIQVSPQTPWFTYVAASMFIPISLHRAAHRSNGKSELLWNLHLGFFVSLMLLLLVIFLSTFTWPLFVVVLMIWLPVLYYHARVLGISPDFFPSGREHEPERPHGDIEKAVFIVPGMQVPAAHVVLYPAQPSDAQHPIQHPQAVPLYPTINVSE